MKFFRLAALIILSTSVGCSPHSVVPAAPQRAPAATHASSESTRTTGPKNVHVDVQDLARRELDQLPALAPVAGQGWATQVAGRNVNSSPGIVGKSERFAFEFEDSTRTECTVFEEPLDAGAYFGNVLEEIKKSLTIVGVYPTGFKVEQEIPIYFVSVRYHKQVDQGTSTGQLKLALGLHHLRPVVCAHDVLGYTQTFESVARTLFANYRVDKDERPTASSISVAKIGELPIGFTRESVREFEDGRSVSLSMSTQIVPRSETEVMVSDEAEGLVIRGPTILEGRYLQSDMRGRRLDLKLTSSGGNRYRVAGDFGSKPLEADFAVKGGLPSPEATRLRLQQALSKAQPFRFTQSEYHASLNPSNAIDVQYLRRKDDPAHTIHVSIGQLEVLVTLDDQAEQIRSEMQVGAQTLIVERVYWRDDRSQNSSQKHSKRKASSSD